jgi:glyoxylase-like metal-dependent hydrolase (beta-lactamase superfamily II)
VAIFSLEAFNAEQGDCFPITFGDESEPTFLVVDGGPDRETYDGRLKPRLLELAGKGRLALPLVACSHIDSDHIGGILVI